MCAAESERRAAMQKEQDARRRAAQLAAAEVARAQAAAAASVRFLALRCIGPRVALTPSRAQASATSTWTAQPPQAARSQRQGASKEDCKVQ